MVEVKQLHAVTRLILLNLRLISVYTVPEYSTRWDANWGGILGKLSEKGGNLITDGM